MPLPGALYTQPMIDQKSGLVSRPWLLFFNSLAIGTGVTSAPADAEYVVSAANATLTAERVATTTATIAVDLATTGQIKWNTVSASQVVSLTATNAQILALPTADLTILAAQGANTLIWPTKAFLAFKTGATAYTNINANAQTWLTVGASSSFFISSFVANDTSINVPLTMVSDFFGTTGNKGLGLTWPFQDDRGAAQDWGILSNIDTLSNLVNQPLLWHFDNRGSGNLTGGNAGNVIKVLVEYVVVTTP